MRVAVIGTAGLPAKYGGFETLAQNLVLQGEVHEDLEFIVFCSGGIDEHFGKAKLVHLSLSANGVQSIAYDFISVISALNRQSDVLLILGVSGAVILPFVRLFSSAKIIANIDGMEWRREKWGVFASVFLKFSEWIARRASHVVIADNAVVYEYVVSRPHSPCVMIPYGGDHALEGNESVAVPDDLPRSYFLSVCRVEPENNAATLLEAFSRVPSAELVFVGNWGASEYGRQLRAAYMGHPNIFLLDPIYEKDLLFALRRSARAYVHGHSAGGTNPSLVEAMHFGMPIFAFDCDFNRATTENLAQYFGGPDELAVLVAAFLEGRLQLDGQALRNVARARYSWASVARSYFELFRQS